VNTYMNSLLHSWSRRSALGLLVFATSRRVSGTGSSEAPTKLMLPELAEGRRRLVLVRHGETNWNAEKRVQGRTDIPLNAAGLKQAELLSEYLADVPFGLIASSPLQRASSTASAIARNHPSARRLADARLKEMCFGNLEGRVLSDEDVVERYGAATKAWGSGDTGKRLPGTGGESPDLVASRGLSALRDIGLLGGGTPEVPCPRYVLIAAHGRFNKILISALTGDVSKSNEIAQGNTCVNVLDIDAKDGSSIVQALNVQDHLATTKDRALATAAP